MTRSVDLVKSVAEPPPAAAPLTREAVLHRLPPIECSDALALLGDGVPRDVCVRAFLTQEADGQVRLVCDRDVALVSWDEKVVEQLRVVDSPGETRALCGGLNARLRHFDGPVLFIDLVRPWKEL